MYEQLVAEYLDFELPELVERDGLDFALPRPRPGNVVYTITGVRRCGKTYAMYQLMSQLVASGVPRDRMLHLSLDDDRILPYGDQTLSELLDAYYRLVPEAEDGCYLFLDEIQDAPHWTNFVRRVSDRANATMVLTGSSSRLLSSDIPTELRGRSLVKELWPLSFAEYCRFHGVELPRRGVASASVARRLENAFGSYLEVGGFPAVQGLGTLERMQLLQGYASQIITKDVLERFGTATYRVVERFSRNALRSTGLKFSVNSQVKALRSAGIPTSNERLHALLDDFEDAHLLFKVGDYTLSVKDNPKSSCKVYSVDPGLALAVAPAGHLDVGQRLETTVFVELKRRFGPDRTNAIASYSAVGCPEVDFVVGGVGLGDPYQLIQVAARLRADDPTAAPEPTSRKYRSEVGNLEQAMAQTGLSEGTLVTLGEKDELSVTSGTVHVVPAWQWFLAERPRP